MLLYSYRPFSCIQYINQQIYSIKCNKQLIIKSNSWQVSDSYVFKHHHLFSGGRPECGTLVLKNVFDTRHELYYVICVLLHFTECICWLIYWLYLSVFWILSWRRKFVLLTWHPVLVLSLSSPPPPTSNLLNKFMTLPVLRICILI